MRLPFASHRRFEASLIEVAGLRRRVLDTEARHDQAEGERRVLARDLADEKAVNERLAEELAATTIVNGRLTDDLSKAREQLAADSVVDVPAEHEAHRKTLAAALGMDAETGWTRLTAEAERLRRSAGVQAVIDATKARQTRAVDEDHRPIDGGSVGPRALASEVLQQKARGDALAAIVETLTAANQACTCAGGEVE